MDGINLDILNAQLRQLQANQRRGVARRVQHDAMHMSPKTGGVLNLR